MSRKLADRWGLDPTVHHLNHGSFGATPLAVLRRQDEWRRAIEENPVRFLGRELFDHLDHARQRLAGFVGAAAQDLAFVANASTGVNAVLRSLRFAPGDEILVTDHGYGAATNAAAYVAARSGAALVTATISTPVAGPDDVVEAIVSRVTSRTRLALVDHVTSATGLVLPIARIVAELDARDIPTLVDGAHAPGMLDLDIAAIGAAYYVGNCHKWLCAPKGAGFLHVHPDADRNVVPVVVGWGRTVVPDGRSQFHADFDWVGTDDPSPYLCVPTAIDVMGGMVDSGWEEIRARNHLLALTGRELLLEALQSPSPAPAAMIGSMAAVPLPPSDADHGPLEPDPLETALRVAGFEIPVTHGPAPRQRWLRLSAQLYNHRDQYAALADAVSELGGAR